MGWGAWLREQVYPKSGFKRATRYVVYRMRRLPDQPHRVARGVFAGFFIGFLPLPGMQFLAAWGMARLMRGNVLAALLGTFNTNPLTTPPFAVFSVWLGHWMLGIEAPLNGKYILSALENALHDLWFNFTALFGPEKAQWDGLAQFFNEIYLPWFIGALGPAIVISAVAYYVTIPLVEAYQKARAATAHERGERRKRMRAKLAEAAAKLKRRSDEPDEGTGDDSAGTP
ncbi:MAG: DUF2062 domain-containing protein [Tabrizicola sp.]|jgi:hypothetical protein|nr:DUF2062 domain-containing protein [Tabrizicola sp.]